jgi:hypothetical protein
MVYTLLFVALNQTPAQLGTYNNLQSCEAAVRSIYETKLTPRGIDMTPQLQESIKFAVDNKIKYQREYTCQKKD